MLKLCKHDYSHKEDFEGLCDEGTAKVDYQTIMKGFECSKCGKRKLVKTAFDRHCLDWKAVAKAYKWALKGA